jgi:hypothetical protein
LEAAEGELAEAVGGVGPGKISAVAASMMWLMIAWRAAVGGNMTTSPWKRA